MLDLRLLRDNPEVVREGMRRRGKVEAHAAVLDLVLRLDAEWRARVKTVEERKSRRNSASQEVARRKRVRENTETLIVETRELGTEIARLEGELATIRSELDGLLLNLPNLTLAEVPEGGESDSDVVRAWGTPRASGCVAPHWEVGERLGILDLARGAKITGSGFPVMRGLGARLTRALMSFMIDLHVRAHGYEELWVPFVVNRATMIGTSQLPKFEEDMYAIRDEDYFLIPTAEVPITNLYRDEVLDAGQLPKAFVAYSPCFRREAGAAGKDTRGLLRLHQFDKVELVRYSAPEDSPAQHELLTRHCEAVLQLLDLPYRVVLLAGGDTGFASAKTYDLEVWSPGVGKWLEVSSSSTFTDFQARRANLRFRPAPGEKPRFLHTLNGSGVAFPRTIAAILEHHQRPDGTVTVPDVLRPYIGVDVLA